MEEIGGRREKKRGGEVIQHTHFIALVVDDCHDYRWVYIFEEYL